MLKAKVPIEADRPQGGGGLGGDDSVILGQMRNEVHELHTVISEMAAREEKLIEMLDGEADKPDPVVPIRRNDFVRRNRTMVKHQSSFNSLMRQMRQDSLPSLGGARGGGGGGGGGGAKGGATATNAARRARPASAGGGFSSTHAAVVDVHKMSFSNLYVTDGDLHVQAVDRVIPGPRGVYRDGQAVPYFGPRKR